MARQQSKGSRPTASNRTLLNIVTGLNLDGQIIPAEIVVGDDERVRISKVLSCKDLALIRPGATGTRYKCLVEKREHYIYHSAGEWFVEQ